MRRELVRRAWGDLRFQWHAALLFPLLVQLASFALIGPLLTWLMRRLVLLSGEPVISNFAIAHFLLSPAGLGFAALLFFSVSATLLAEFAGQTWIAGQAMARRPAPLSTAVAAVIGRAPALVQLSFFILLRLALLASPFVVAIAFVWAAILRGHDINFYLAEHPPQWRHALLLAGLLGAAYGVFALWQLGRWILAIPILLYEGPSPQHALEESARRSRRSLRAILTSLLVWWLLLLAIGRLVAGLMHQLENAALSWAGVEFARVLPLVTLFVIVNLTCAFLLNAVLIAGHQFFVTRFYAEQLDPDARQAAREGEGTPTVGRRIAWGTLAVICLLLAGGLALMWWVAAHGSPPSEVAITAHRGNSSRAPENSLAAFRAAIDAQADYSELDVQRTRDGVVVVLHDGDLMRMADDPRKIGDLTMQDLTTIDIGRKRGPAFVGERVPTLAAVIALVRGRMKLNVELKYNAPDPQLAGTVVDVLRREQFLDQVVISSLSAAALEQVRALEPRLRIGQIVTVAVGDVTRAGTDFLSLSSMRATPEVIRRAHAAGKAVHVWTLNRPELMLRMIERGADNLLTDYPELAARVLQQRRSLSASEQFALRLRVLFSDLPPEIDAQAETTL
jgi:glycerophosphoryl diester phosphodiesterase